MVKKELPICLAYCSIFQLRFDYIIKTFFFSGDVGSKRSDDVVAKTKAKTVVENLDIMINYMLER